MQAMPPPWSETVTKTPNWPLFTFTRTGAGSQPRPAAVRAVALIALCRISRRITRRWPGMYRIEERIASSTSTGTSQPCPDASDADRSRMKPTGLVGCRMPMATPAGFRAPGGTGTEWRKWAPRRCVPMREVKKRSRNLSSVGASPGSRHTSCLRPCPSRRVTFWWSSNIFASASQYSATMSGEFSWPKSSCMLYAPTYFS
mmetsp:Transcript_56655/g.165733  ORF Transcript_56655/g.165733 Transcript_56655/m.165733 type:complete len:201 (+) Transcript_56655:550-1152(+)